MSAVHLPADAARRVAEDQIVWLTTVTDQGIPAPNPVWFVADGDDLVIFSDPTSRKVHNIRQRPTVTLHFNCDQRGSDVVVITGEATATPDRPPSGLRPYVAKYDSAITNDLATTIDELDETYNTEIRVRPTHVR